MADVCIAFYRVHVRTAGKPMRIQSVDGMEVPILFATGNRAKATELAALLGRPVEAIKLDLPEIQSIDVAAVALAKARSAFAIVGRPVIVDDTGLSLDALNGLPGALVAWFLDRLGVDGLAALVKDHPLRKATASTAIGYADASGSHVFIGTVTGTVALSPRGTNGFGYDPIFCPGEGKLTYAELTAEQKNATSMRADATRQLRNALATLGSQPATKDPPTRR